MNATVADILRWYPELRPTPQQLRACRYLENRGFEICTHFGIDNAIELAREDWRKRRRRRKAAK